MPVMLFIFLILVVWIRYESTKSSRFAHKAKDNFWKIEQEANFTRKKDITDLDYIEIPLDQLPFIEACDPVLNSLQTDIKKLSEKKILNLTGLTNTWLKQQYGTPNLEFLTSYDENFTRLIRTLYKWGTCLNENNYKSQARTVLEYGIACKTDISGNYILLGQIYKEQSEFHALDCLIDTANAINTLLKPSILSALYEIKNT